MRKRLNKTTVDRLQPGPARYDVIDDHIKGFIIRVNTDGTKTAILRYRREGRNRAHKLGVLGGGFTVHQARTAAAAARAMVDQGGDPARERDARKAAPTFAEVAERFMAEIVRPYRKPRTASGYEGLLRVHLLPAFGHMKIGEIERADVQRLHQRIGESTRRRKSTPDTAGKPSKPTTGAANRALALVSVIMTNAERWGYRDTRANPCHRMEKYPERPRDRYLSGEERARLAAVLARAAQARKGQPDYVSPGAIMVIRLLGLTGARCGEIVGLQWPMVDLERSCLRLPDSKTGAKVIPLSPQAVGLLAEIERSQVKGVPWVCPSECGGPVPGLERTWRVLRKRAGLQDVCLHDLRHSAASDMAEAGLSLPFIGQVLGHKTQQTTARYAHFADRSRQEAARVMGEQIERSTHAGAERLREREQQRAAGPTTETT